MDKVTKNKPKKTPGRLSLAVVNPDAAGIDISATMHAVVVPEGRDKEFRREFGAFTEDLQEIARWLTHCRITTVAMESTGVYWKQLYLVLVEHGFTVSLVNARHVKNVTGRKNDMDDAQWIQKLHSCGLLTSSFLPDEHTEKLRTVVRHRRNLLQDSSRYVLRMQKALEMMNIKIHSVINDITGKTGTAIIEAIIRGERKGEGFLKHVDPRIRADKATIVKSLTGNWRDEHLFCLEENYLQYKSVQQRIASCDSKIEEYLQYQVAQANEGVIEAPAVQKTRSKKQKTKNQPVFNVTSYLHKIHGVDVTQIFGISEGSALEILAETGTDLSKWENAKKFVGWLNLCPNNKISGGKPISSRVMKKKTSTAAQAFRAAANSVQRSDNWLGDYFRRMKSKGGNKHAIVATARKIAIIYYKLVTEKVNFKPVDADEYREKYKAAKISYLERQLTKLKATA